MYGCLYLYCRCLRCAVLVFLHCVAQFLYCRQHPTGPDEDHSLDTTLGQPFQMHTRTLPEARHSSRRFSGLPNFISCLPDLPTLLSWHHVFVCFSYDLSYTDLLSGFLLLLCMWLCLVLLLVLSVWLSLFGLRLWLYFRLQILRSMWLSVHYDGWDGGMVMVRGCCPWGYCCSYHICYWS